MQHKKVIFLICVLAIVNSTFGANAHYYFHKRKKIEGYLSYDVYVINLNTGEKTIAIPAKKWMGVPFILSDHSKIIFNWGVPYVYDTMSKSIENLSHLGNTLEICNVTLIPSTNEIFISMVKRGAKVISKKYHFQEHTYISIDKNTYAVVDTINGFADIKSVISRDGEEIYKLVESKDGIYFEGRNIKSGPSTSNTFAIDGYKNMQFKRDTWLSSTGNGYALVGYRINTDDKRHYVLCDPENKKSITEFTWTIGIGINTFISPTGNNLIIEIEGYSEEERYFPTGNVYILDANTAELKHRYKFQTSDDPDAESKIFILGDSLYFFPEDPKESDATHFDNIGQADVTKVQSNISLAEMMTADVEDAYKKGWIDNKGIYNSLSKKLENAQKQLEKGKTKQALNHLNAFLNQLKAQKGKHVNEEAYNLLHFNVEALIERMEK
ncbi:MAG: hypothetical protein R6V04_01115 [bacterium]